MSDIAIAYSVLLGVLFLFPAMFAGFVLTGHIKGGE